MVSRPVRWWRRNYLTGRVRVLAALLLTVAFVAPAVATTLVVYVYQQNFNAGQYRGTPGYANRYTNRMFTNSAIPPNRPLKVLLKNTVGGDIAGSTVTGVNDIQWGRAGTPVYALASCGVPAPYSHYASCHAETQ